jgi:hypothetical protein
MGVVHLHEISQARLTSAKGVDLKLDFRQLYPSAVNNVILATTKWIEVVDPGRAQARELELSEKYHIGSNMVRFDGTHASARAIIDLILKKDPRDGPPILQELLKLRDSYPAPPKKPKPKKKGLAGFFGFFFK